MNSNFTHNRIRRTLACISACLVAAGMSLQVSARSDTRTAPVDLVFAGTADLVDPNFQGRTLQYRFEIDNLSQDTISDVVVRSATPEGTTFRSVTNPAGECTTPDVGGTGAIECAVGTVAPAATVAIEFAFDDVAPAGTEILFEVTAEGSNGFSRTVVEPTFIVAEGDPVLRWEPPNLMSGGRSTPPRLVRVETAEPPIFTPVARPVEPQIPGTVYNVYRSESADVIASPDTLVLTVPDTQTNSGALPAEPGYFYAVTFEDLTGETPLSNDVSFGKGEPVIETLQVIGGTATITGTNFDDAVEVTLDGIAFARPARVTDGGTQVVVKGKLATGVRLRKYLKTHGPALFCFRNSNGSASCALSSPLVIVPGAR